MYHTGIIRLITEAGALPLYDLSYGGFTKSFYVPAYRMFVASLSLISGTDPATTAALATIAFGVAAAAAIYLLGREIGGEWVGVCAAFLFVLSPEITIYTIRPFPEVLGIPLMLLAFYFVVKQRLGLAIIASVLTALTHQTTAVVLGAVLLVYGLLARDKKSFVALACAAAAYFAWQLVSLNSLDILSMRQIALKESGAITLSHIERIGAFALLFAPFALPAIARDWKKHAMTLSFLVATLLLAKNDWFGIGIFNDRLFTYFAIAAVLVGAIGLAEIWKALEATEWK